ncbi:MAG: ATP-binding protein [Candidatus Xenobia bacterium]
MLTSACSTGLGTLLWRHITVQDVAMLYLAGIAVVAGVWGLGPSVLAACLSAICFDFYFTQPYYELLTTEHDWITMGVMFGVAFVLSNLLDRLRSREQRTATLYALARDLSRSSDQERILEAALQHVHQVVQGSSQILLGEDLEPAGAAQALQDRQPVHAGSRWYLPLIGGEERLGVLCIDHVQPNRDQLDLLQHVATQIATALERARLVQAREKAMLAAEAERLRNTLLSSVSHDLRTPLASITGAASSLLDTRGDYTVEARRDLAATIYEEAQRLNRLVTNLLDVTRLQSGTVQLGRQWHSLEELIGTALSRFDDALQQREVGIEVPSALPLVEVDSMLIEQLLGNLIENAIKYTPERSSLEVRARVIENEVRVEVADSGPGLPPGQEERIFEKFQRGTRGAGLGLGLAICRAIAEVHGGSIRAANRPQGGAVFTLVLPRSPTPPTVKAEETP